MQLYTLCFSCGEEHNNVFVGPCELPIRPIMSKFRTRLLRCNARRYCWCRQSGHQLLQTRPQATYRAPLERLVIIVRTPDVLSASLRLLLRFDSISEPLSQRTHLAPRRRPPQKSKPFSAGRQDAKQRAPLVAHAPRCTVAQKLCRSRHQRMQSDGRKKRISAAA